MLLVEFFLVLSLRWMRFRPFQSSSSALQDTWWRRTENWRSMSEAIWKLRRTYCLLHSTFIWLSRDISWIICNLVASSGAPGMACGTAIVGAGAIGLNAVFSWGTVNVFTCTISFLMQKPDPHGTITSERWNDRIGTSDDRDDDGWTVPLSRNIPVTVSKIIVGCRFWRKRINSIQLFETHFLKSDIID